MPRRGRCHRWLRPTKMRPGVKSRAAPNRDGVLVLFLIVIVLLCLVVAFAALTPRDRIDRLPNGPGAIWI